MDFLERFLNLTPASVPGWEIGLPLLTVPLQILYTLCVIGLAVYSGQALLLSAHRLRLNRREQAAPAPPQAPPLPPQAWPPVTVQLPVYNEQHVIESLINACAGLDYPRHLLQIQVLDDSTDITTGIAQRTAQGWQSQGVNVTVVRREERAGYKAGALDHGLTQATGEFIAIFDADFVPEPDFLRRAIPHFFQPGQDRLAFVQGRWGHLNRDYSPLTQAQALALDGHFVVEQAGRQAAGYPFGFNGSGGVWRRSCIEDPAVGGWHADTLCEDLDLSYRAQLAGWRPCFVEDLEAPAEIPPQLLAFKQQQFRWAKGSVQTLRKLGGRVWRSGWSPMQRLLAFCHLGNYLIHPLLLLLLLITLPLLLLDVDPFWPLAYLSLVSVGPPLLYALAQRRLWGRGWLRRWAYLPLLTLLGTGLCLSNSLAVAQALSGKEGAFVRTPKFRVARAVDRWQRSSYVVRLNWLFWGELGLALYALITAAVAVSLGNWWTLPFLAIYTLGFGAMAGVGLYQSWAARPRQERPRPQGTHLNSVSSD